MQGRRLAFNWKAAMCQNEIFEMKGHRRCLEILLSLLLLSLSLLLLSEVFETERPPTLPGTGFLRVNDFCQLPVSEGHYCCCFHERWNSFTIRCHELPQDKNDTPSLFCSEIPKYSLLLPIFPLSLFSKLNSLNPLISVWPSKWLPNGMRIDFCTDPCSEH